MDTSEALRIIRSLADGVDPHTHEKLPSIFHHPDTVRALFLAVAALEKAKNAEESRALLPQKAGTRWTHQEEDSLIASFENGSSVSQLAALHHRTEGSIRAKLIKAGKLPPEAWNAPPADWNEPPHARK